MGQVIKTCVILCGGEILDYAAVRSNPAALHARDFYCADSGWRHCGPLDVTPSLLVGDFDSIGEIPANIPLLRLPADKNHTDTAYAAREAAARGFEEILFAGVGGGRPDHTMANLQTMAGLARQGIRVTAADGVSDIIVHAAPVQGRRVNIPRREGCYFSVLSLGETCKNVTITGGKYPLNGYNLRFDEARAVSNEFLDTDAFVNFDEGVMLIITTKRD